MCGSSLARWLLLCLELLVMVVVRIQGEVITLSNLTAVAGLPIMLGCNVTLATEDKVMQVRWLDQHNQLLLSYETGRPVRLTKQHDGVTLLSSHYNVSLITIKRADLSHEGCYRCVFDIYPSGGKEGQTCLTIETKAINEGNKTAVSGTLATLSCWYGIPDRVQQVLWRKTANQGDTIKVASFSKRGNPSIDEPFQGRTVLSHTLGTTELSIQPVRTEDEGCYTCEFHTYPEGTRSAKTCLFVYEPNQPYGTGRYSAGRYGASCHNLFRVLPNPAITFVTSNGIIEANCTTTARPAAHMIWNVEGENGTLGPSTLSAQDQGDGTTFVTSTLYLQEKLLPDLPVKCIVHHQGLESPMSVYLNLNVGPALATVISVSCVVVLLICSLCVCLCKCFLC
ncbi:hypothetical protein UPYG_G00024980 [Umbra pygmaea]|uniref:Ig-like domain-containing protein n=1 Tax=Umbra pygmaea TaxID=75934 RepID=A0ABD0XLP9_UMBPY